MKATKVMKKPLVVPKMHSSHWGYYCLYMADPVAKQYEIYQKTAIFTCDLEK
jgi:hypothetical protein